MKESRIPAHVDIDDARYMPDVTAGGRIQGWVRLARPTMIAYSLCLHFDGVQLPTLAVHVPFVELPPPLKELMK